MARSMVSIGTDASRALANMVRSVAFEFGSPPPSRAATSTWRISLAKSLPRALSCAPFLCLMVAHLEWPDMSDASQEELMKSEVARDLGMERGDEDGTLPAQDGPVVDGGEHLDALAGPLDDRGPDEHGVDGVVDPGH